MKDFNFRKLNSKHKKWFIINQILVYSALLTAVGVAVKLTNPVLITNDDKLTVSSGVIVGIIFLLMGFSNRAKQFIRIPFVAFMFIWLLSLGFKTIIDTVIWSSGLMLIPLMIDDLILKQIWKGIWYKHYD